MNDFAMTKTSGKLNIIKIELKKMKSLHRQMSELINYGDCDEGIADLLMDMSNAMQEAAKAVDFAASEIWTLMYKSRPPIQLVVPSELEAVKEAPVNEPV
ncbi:MAG: hypothetical protein Q4E64_03880 [Phascolarctobacterium sp.]|uniref:hypothetical protein n=1 Tax=Phascolarctobacterium sp. TaxID=2049039 RepID=UPI0026DC55A5|nr:hypothetical protein [Phascolarctobacterium sp.]MDO4920953.1 hypothetical protein [Phascolarctobacterium sp.]